MIESPALAVKRLVVDMLVFSEPTLKFSEPSSENVISDCVASLINDCEPLQFPMRHIFGFSCCSFF